MKPSLVYLLCTPHAVGTADDGTPGLKVVVQVQGKVIAIPCGLGTQTIRWLAMVAAQRYKALHIPGGRSRQLEAHLSSPGAFLPLSVTYTASGKLVGPATSIRDAVASAGGHDAGVALANQPRAGPCTWHALPPTVVGR